MRRIPLLHFVLCAAVLCGAVKPLAGQAPNTSPSPDSIRRGLTLRPSYLGNPVRLLIVGTYHFSNPGLDVVNPEADDVRSPRRQAELSALLDDLARFAPTRVAVERTVSVDSAVQARYAEIRAGAVPGLSETEQIGMRLAARLGHERVDPVDYSMDLAMGEVFGRAEGEIASRVQPVMGFIGEIIGGQIRSGSIQETLLMMNDFALMDAGHGLYLELALVGAGTDHVGAAMAGDWYQRNLRIFANLAHVARPGDRIVLVIGSGHVPLIRHYAEMTPGFDVVPLSDYVTVPR